MKSAKEIIATIKDVYYMLVGSGKEEKNIRQLIKKYDLEKHFKLISWVNYNMMPKIYNLADIFLYPSYQTKVWKEQFGFALVEAMCCGVPIITTKSGAIPEVVGDCAIFVKEKDHVDLTRKIVELIENDVLRKKLAIKGINRAKKRFSLDVIAKKHIQFFERVVNNI